MENNHDILDKLNSLTSFEEDLVFVTFMPFSYLIVNELKKITSRIAQQKLLQSIFWDERTSVLIKTEIASTTIFDNHNTRDQYWKDTQNMAKVLNDNGIDVCFLPEDGPDVPQGTKRADAIIKYRGIWYIADFKVFTSINVNTLSENLVNGFQQANCIILKVENAHFGIFRDSIDYLIRNNHKFGSIIVINEYNRILPLTAKQLKLGRYKKMMKGFL